MSSFKRIGIILLVGAVLMLLSVSFTGTDISARTIVLGLGVDYDVPNGKYVVTAEVVSPGGGSEQQVGTFSKLVNGEGETVEGAVNSVYATTGRETSLGQCLVIVLGESLYKNKSLDECLAYFDFSDNIRDSVSVCCAETDARELMQTILPLVQSFSFSLVNLMKDSGEMIDVPSNILCDFSEQQISVAKCSYVNSVRFVEDNNSDADTSTKGKRTGTFDCGRAAVFKEHRYVVTLDKEESAGFNLLGKSIGQVYKVKNDETDPETAQIMSLRINKKSADMSFLQKDGEYRVNIELELRMKRTYMGGASADTGGVLYPETSKNLNEKVLSEAAIQARAQVEKFLAKSREFDFDIIGVHSGFYGKYGKKYKEERDNLKLGDFLFDLKIKAVED